MKEQPSILIVDDQVDNQRLLVSLLKPEYRLLVAGSGETALAALNAAKKPDLILLDIMMPGLDGYETCRRIKARLDLAAIPIIFLTARVDTESEAQGLQLGAVDYVTKPINPPVLRARIAAHLALAEKIRRATMERDISHRIVAKVSRERDEIDQLARRLEREIAERARAETQLRIVSQAVTHAPVSIVITDAEGSIVYVNPYFSQITGYAPEEAIGQNPRVLKSGQMDEDFYRHLWETISAGEIWRGEVLNKNKAGGLFWEAVAISPIHDDHGNITHYVGVKEDIGDRKELERVKEDVERIMRHDLKSPLNAVIAFPELLLLDDSLDADQRESIELILESGCKMRDMIDLSLDLFKMETGQYAYQAYPVDLLPILRQLKQFNESRLIGQQLQVRLRLDDQDDVPEAVLWVLADARLLFSLLSNLFVNAIEASPRGECIEVNLCSGNPVELRLSNRGAVPEALRTHFFEKYRTLGKQGGTGLGTYSAKLLADTMGMELAMETSDLDDRTCLSLYLPANG
ncbi:Nitrogen fixation regulatory protein [Thiorhodovibrio winogradskyi]|uniref:histidine kinase n=1 Tax=Thiorhodovibrio winogradskyi TaxID=77007 RepID=A0ABZ0SAJ7_9GAMM|nr:response regulator [Thiorhodovibrio winogradskyi]